MARKPRILIEGGFYHVMLRGNGGDAIFFSDDDRVEFERLVAEGVTRFGHRIHAYCWMTNHVHLAIQTESTPLSKIIQNLAFRYTRWVHRRQNQIGHLFQGRYKAIMVEADSYFLELVRYIHLNPVRAGLVRNPEDHFWSGHDAYLGRRHVAWLTTEWVLSQWGTRINAARARYRQFVREGVAEGRREDFHRGNQAGQLLGRAIAGVAEPQRDTANFLRLCG